MVDVFVLPSRLPTVWSSTSHFVPANVAARQRHTRLRPRGPHAHASTVSSTSAPTAKSPTTARPPAGRWCPGPASPPRRPRSYQGALAARGTSGGCEEGFNVLTEYVIFHCAASVSGSSDKKGKFPHKHILQVAFPIQNNWLKHLFKSTTGTINLSVSPGLICLSVTIWCQRRNWTDKLLNCTFFLLCFKMKLM